jgi:hypothetical protein
MRKFVVMLSSLATMLVASLGLGTATAAASDVLTVGSVGGTNVAVGDTLFGPTTGNEVFASGFASITCTGGGTTGTVSSNPAAPGTATITGTGLLFRPTNPGTCNSNLGVATVSASAPGSLSVSSSGVVSVNGSSGNFTVPGPTSCSYKVASAQTGTASNSDNSISFNQIPVSKTAGGVLCSSTGTETIKFAPIEDSTQSNGKVFVN